jgi:hypothetical protein
VVENGQVAGGAARRVGQGGDEPAAVAGPSGAGGDGDLGVDDPDGDAAEAGQPGAVGQAAQDGEPRAPFPVRTRIRKSALVCVIFRARNPAAKFRSASRSIPACRLGSSKGVQVVSPQETGRNTASITVRVPQLTRASSRSCG